MDALQVERLIAQRVEDAVKQERAMWTIRIRKLEQAMDDMERRMEVLRAKFEGESEQFIFGLDI